MSVHKARFLPQVENAGAQPPPSAQPLTFAAPYWVKSVVVNNLAYLRDHRVAGEVIYPAAGYSAAGIAIYQALQGTRHLQKSFLLSCLRFHQKLALVESDSTLLRLGYDPSRHGFSVYSCRHDDNAPATLHAAGRFARAEPPSTTPDLDLDQLLARCDESVDVAGFYQRLRRSGFEYGPFFQSIRGLRTHRRQREALAWLTVHPELEAVGGLWVRPITLLDAAFQSLAATLHDEATGLYVPVRVQAMRVHDDFKPGMWCHARLLSSNPRVLDGDITLFDSNGHPTVEVCGLRCLRVTRNHVAVPVWPVNAERQDRPSLQHFSQQHVSLR